MNNKYLIFMILSVLIMSCRSKETTFVFVESTDTHGHFVDFARDATLIRRLRDSLGERMILLDNGDNLQGTTFQYYSNHDTNQPNITAQFLNFFPYDVAGVGNHDIEAGRKVFDRVYGETKVPVVCANVVDESSGKPYFKPYVVLERAGYRIAVLGLLTPYVVTWVPERLRPGLVFEPVETAAAQWVKVIRETEKPDLLVGLFHSGWDSEPLSEADAARLGRENAAKWVAEHVPGFDLVFLGHDHRHRTDIVVNDEGDTVGVLDAGCRGEGLALATVTMRNGKKAYSKVDWVNTEQQVPDPEFQAMVQPYLDAVDSYQNRVVAELSVDINSDDAYKGPCLWVDAIHRCQLDVVRQEGVGADISIAAPLGSGKNLKAGLLTVKDFFTWYPFENSLAVLSMTGEEVRRFLEYAFEQKDPIFNFDSGADILYEVDESKPFGERVHIKSMADGALFSADSIYHVVMNSYRSMGGGNHLSQGVGWDRADIQSHIIWESESDLRSLFIDWAAQQGRIEAETLYHWKRVGK